MVDHEQRECLADAVHALAAGMITNDAFPELLRSGGIRFLDYPWRYRDAALGPIIEHAWCLYHEDYEYKLAGRHRLTAERRHEVLRWVLFLRSELEYEWPRFRFINPALASLDGCLLSLLTFGILPCLRQSREFKKWQQSGDFSVWPFVRRSDYDAVRREFCPFARLLTTGIG